MTINELTELLDEFLTRWQIEEVKKLTLQEYVSIGNKDTFCQWIETKTRMLGSIKGMSSIKFGIYERIDPQKRPKNYENDNKYSWLRRYRANTKEEAFKFVKSDIIKIIKLSEKGQFNKIDEIILPDLFKWKVAFLYSNERLIPIYKKEILDKIAHHFGLQINKQTQISEIHELMISNKPANKDVYSYMYELCDQFGKVEEKEIISGKSDSSTKARRRTGRTRTSQRNTQNHVRTITSSYIIEQKHNKIQEALKKHLAEKYGEENVILEENYVDVKLIQPKFLGFYEVKSSSYASDCIKEALGQILLYTHNDQDDRKKKIYIVGQYPANKQDKSYIEFVKKNLNLEFDYINVEIE